MKKQTQKPQIWAGIECTINRLSSGYKDQSVFNGHYNRTDDLDAIAELGVKTLRYPILWEKHQPSLDYAIDFTWISDRLEQMRNHGIEPIAGLLHHGSGPLFTNLADPQFPELFAQYAKQVALKFPWLKMYTPINEPLTTARFSGLYGHWYPHEQNDVSFVRMLLNQLKATVLAMKEIRKVNPKAMLVQTEDMGKTYSTPLLEYQARMENERRYLTFDILCGQFNISHPQYDHFMHLGIDAAELKFFIDNPCPPNIIGVNYYCTSERFLDEALEKYPPSRHGGNTLHAYADVEAVRVKLNEPHGFKVLATEMWQRYHIPIAVTEAHLHCSREGQMKWFLEIYESACELAETGIDLLAVTAWSILGSYGWNKLLTSDEMEYERGTFDVSSGKRRQTAMFNVLKSLVNNGSYSNPVLQSEGWWKSESRYFSVETQNSGTASLANSGRPILIIGSTGTLGNGFAKICSQRSLHHVLIGRAEMDICNPQQVESAIQKYRPWAIINAAGFVRVDDAEADSDNCFRENTTGPETLARACKQHDIKLMTFSSDLVFDGQKNAPYIESDAVNPLNVYGQSKAFCEQTVLNILPESLVVRTSAFFGPWDQYNFAHYVINELNNDNLVYASTDVITPTYVPHLVNAALDLLIDDERGIWHLANSEPLSWLQFAQKIANRAGLNESMVSEAAADLPAKRPYYSALSSEKGILMPTLNAALDEYFNAVDHRNLVERT